MKFKLLFAFLLFAICFAMPKYASAQSGSLDLSFDTDGKVTTPFPTGGDDVANAIARQWLDGKIIAVGFTDNGANEDFAVVRYNLDGSVDTSFGNAGMVATDIGGFNDYANGVAIQTDGKIVAVGYGRASNNNDIVVVRYNLDGSLDTTFNSDGIATTPIGNSSDYGFAVAIQTDNKIVVAGSSAGFALVRYNTDGSLDSTFNLTGKVKTAIGNSSEALSIALQTDGKIVVAGYSSQSGAVDVALARYNTDGSLDLSFDGDGKVVTDISGFLDRAYSVDIQNDGRIVVAGVSYDSLNSNFLGMRYLSNGTLDSSFGGDGIVTSDIASYNESARSLKIQNDGKIFVAGLSYIGNTSFVVLLCYQSNGSFEPSFDTDGIVTTNIGSSCEGNAVALQNDGKIIVAGYSLIGGNADFALARYNNTLSSTFNFNSQATVETKIVPNPFSSLTAVYTNAILENASLSLYNSLGMQVAEINQISGSWITLYRNNLPSGVYFMLLLQDNKLVKTEKIIISD